MSDDENQNRISLEDHSDRPISESQSQGNMDNKENVTPQGSSEDKENVTPQKDGMFLPEPTQRGVPQRSN